MVKADSENPGYGSISPKKESAAPARLILCCFLLPLLFLQPSCLPSSPNLEESANHILTPEGLFAHKYLVLHEAANNGDTETVSEMIRDLLALDPSPEIYAQTATLLERNNQTDKALEIARQGAGLHPDEYDLHMLLAELLEQRGAIDEALKVLQKYAAHYESMSGDERLDKLKEFTGMRQYIAYLLLERQRTAEAAAYIAAIPRAERSPFILFYEILILRRQKQDAQASAKLRELVRIYPDFTDGWLTLAADMEKKGDYKTAAFFYQKALENSPLGDIYLFMIAAVLKAGDTDAALRKVLETSFNSEIKLRAALLFMTEKKYPEARLILLSLEGEPYLVDDVNLYLGMIAYDSGTDMPEALERLRDISPDAPNRARMLHLKTLLHIRLDDYPAALETARNMRDDYPDVKDNWAFLAELANASKDYTLAENVSREGLEQWPDEIPLLYSLALSLSFQNKNAEAISFLEEILLLDDNHMVTLNTLGYILAEEKRDLERALLLVKKALEQQPDNVHILDSLAWVYYQMDNYHEAWRVIKKCEEKGIDDAVIWDHYGDIALALNNKKDALHGYAKALTLKPDNSIEIRTKLEGLK
jgi:tetratricopeptide (TPR) repeat protein